MVSKCALQYQCVKPCGYDCKILYILLQRERPICHELKNRKLANRERM